MGHLRQQITPLDSGVEMLQTLEGMFAKSTVSERQASITDLINTRMTGGRVKDHCLAMISHISRAEVMGAKLQKEMKIDLILQSLPKHFNQFEVNYNMHKMDLTPVQLMHELESVEQSLKERGSINFMEGSVKPKGKPKGANKNKKKKAVIPVRAGNEPSCSGSARKKLGSGSARELNEPSLSLNLGLINLGLGSGSTRKSSARAAGTHPSLERGFRLRSPAGRI